MQRRNVLRTAALLPLLYGVSTALLSASRGSKTTTRMNRRGRPPDLSWPSNANWGKLRKDVSGQLVVPQPLFGSCAAAPSGQACLTARKNMDNPFWIGDQPAGTQVSGWLDAWTPAPSAYAIKALDAADVVAGVNFARENNLRLVVKGAGHS